MKSNITEEMLDKAGIERVSEKRLCEIIDNRNKESNIGWYYVREEEDGTYTGVDNSTGHAWTENFATKELCVGWLLGQFEMGDIEHGFEIDPKDPTRKYNLDDESKEEILYMEKQTGCIAVTDEPDEDEVINQIKIAIKWLDKAKKVTQDIKDLSIKHQLRCEIIQIKSHLKYALSLEVAKNQLNPELRQRVVKAIGQWHWDNDPYGCMDNDVTSLEQSIECAESLTDEELITLMVEIVEAD